MIHEIEWNGRRIAYELFARKSTAYLTGSGNLYVDGERIAEGVGNWRVSECITGEFYHKGFDAPVELNVRAGFITAKCELTVDGKVVYQEKVPFWQIDGGVINLLINIAIALIILSITLSVVTFLLIIKM